MRIGRRGIVVIALVVIGLLFLAWFDGGEEPVRPIVDEVSQAGEAA